MFGDFCANKSCLLWSQKLLRIYDFHMEKNPGMMGPLLGASRRTLMFLGCHTTVRGCAKRYDHFSYTENQSNMHGQHDLQNSYLLKE